MHVYQVSEIMMMSNLNENSSRNVVISSYLLRADRALKCMILQDPPLLGILISRGNVAIFTKKKEIRKGIEKRERKKKEKVGTQRRKR